MPLAAAAQDFLSPVTGAPLAWLSALVLGLPTLVELTGLDRDASPSWPRVAGWHLFYSLWLGALFWAIPAGLVRLGLLALGGPAGALPPAWLAALPFGIASFGVIVRPRRYVTTELRVPLRGLPAAFDGLRIVQLSDLHVGRFFPPARLHELVARAAALRPDLLVITGDIVDDSARFAPAAAAALAAHPPPLGVHGCLGNHDHWAGGEPVRAALQAGGVNVLGNRGVALTRGDATLWLCGVDDLWFHADVSAALRDRPVGACTILLAHQPAVAREACEHDVQLVLSGHTHGGQLAVPWLPQWSLARLISPWVQGLYTLGETTLFVSRGAGVIRPLVRLGAPPEIATLVLVAAGANGLAVLPSPASERPAP